MAGPHARIERPFGSRKTARPPLIGRLREHYPDDPRATGNGSHMKTTTAGPGPGASGVVAATPVRPAKPAISSEVSTDSSGTPSAGTSTGDAAASPYRELIKQRRLPRVEASRILTAGAAPAGGE